MHADPNPSRAVSPEDLIGPLNDVERRNAPALVYLIGHAELAQSGRRVAIVGSRKATEEGLKRAARLARILAENRITVVSGLAEGIDASAHRSAIHHGGRTIAVIGTPLDRAYPASNADLQHEIAREHLVISQFAPGLPVQKQNFVLRNRTMALISDASVIVEAGEGSGTLSQGWEALRLGRPLFLMKSVASNPTLSWPAEMLDYGALVLSEPEELMGALPPERLREPQDAPF
jgi:DNA processing protein